MSESQLSTVAAERFTALVGVLNRERDALERLVFKLTQAGMLAEAKEARFMAMISDEIDTVAADLGGLELARAMIVDDVAAALSLTDDEPSLAGLIARAPEPVREPLIQLHHDLTKLMTDLDEVRERGSWAITERIAAMQADLERLESAGLGADGYDRWGHVSSADVVPTRFDDTA